jgi:hypothetical protein
MSGDPHVSASQCTTPETKSAMTNPNMNALAMSQGYSAARGKRRETSQVITAQYTTMLAISKWRTARL